MKRQECSLMELWIIVRLLHYRTENPLPGQRTYVSVRSICVLTQLQRHLVQTLLRAKVEGKVPDCHNIFVPSQIWKASRSCEEVASQSSVLSI